MKGGLFQILFVCTGNICRSPMAEGILRARLSARAAEFSTVGSAGVAAVPGVPASSHSVTACRRHQIDITGHRSRPLTRDMAEEADLILVMEEHHRSAVLRSWRHLDDRTFVLGDFGAVGEHGPGGGVLDPIGQDLDVYIEVYEMIDDYITRALPRIEQAIAEAARSV